MLFVDSTVAKIYNYPHMRKGMTIVCIFSYLKAGSPLGPTPATVAASLHPYRTEGYHLVKQVIHAFIDASKVKESLA